MVAKTIGFNWGPAGTSCSQWTGVRLADVLQHCGMQGPEKNANYVCFRGPKQELPQGVTARSDVWEATITFTPAACCASRAASVQHVRVQCMRGQPSTRRVLLLSPGRCTME